MKQKLLNYEEYIDNQFYDIANNISEAFNNAINKTINFTHPKLSILVNKLKSYLKLRMNNYYQFINNIIGDENINSEINIKDYIFEKLISFIKKYNLVFNNEIN